MTDEVLTLKELNSLDSDEIVRGYMHKGAFPEGASKAFIHGWLNSQVDSGRFKASDAQKELAKLYVKNSKG